MNKTSYVVAVSQRIDKSAEVKRNESNQLVYLVYKNSLCCPTSFVCHIITTVSFDTYCAWATRMGLICHHPIAGSYIRSFRGRRRYFSNLSLDRQIITVKSEAIMIPGKTFWFHVSFVFFSLFWANHVMHARLRARSTCPQPLWIQRRLGRTRLRFTVTLLLQVVIYSLVFLLFVFILSLKLAKWVTRCDLFLLKSRKSPKCTSLYNFLWFCLYVCLIVFPTPFALPPSSFLTC